MKRITLMVAFSMATLVPMLTMAQAVRHDMILEIATGTWCQYCPGSAMGADELAASGANVGVVEHHGGDVYEIPASDGRLNYYAVTGFPTSWFDGANALVGGSNTVSLFPSYAVRYDAAIAAATPFEINASWVQNGANIDVTVNVEQLGAYSGSALRVQAAVTESEIMVNWQGMSQCDFMNRAMYPNHGGIPITTTQGGPAVSNTFTMAIDPTWVQQHMELVVWVEDSLTKQIFNGKMLPLSTAANAVDVAMMEVSNNVASQSCITGIEPEIVIRNNGNDPLTAATFTYNVNGGTASTFNWTGNLAYYDYATITLPNLNFTPQANNLLTVTVTVPSDASSSDNDGTKAWAEASTHPSGTFMVRIKPDSYGSEISWDIKSSTGTVIGSGGPYIDGNRIQINVPVAVPMNDCFTFSMYDSFGDGFGVGPQAGWFRLEAPNGDTIYAGGDFGSLDMVDFKTDNTVKRDVTVQEEISVFPNPSKGVFKIRTATLHPDGVTLTVMASNGQTVFRTTSTDVETAIDLSALASGMYLLRIQTAEGVVVKKLNKE